MEGHKQKVCSSANPIRAVVKAFVLPNYSKMCSEHFPALVTQAVMVSATKANEWLTNSFELQTGGAAANEKIAVFTLTEMWIKTLQCAQGFCPDHYGRRDCPILITEGLRQSHWTRVETAEDLVRKVAVKRTYGTVDRIALRMVFYIFSLYFQFLRHPDVVIIKKS